METGTKRAPLHFEKSEKTIRKGKRLFYWSLACGILFTLVFGGFYYSFEYSARLKKLQDSLESRVVTIEDEQKETYKLMLQMTATLQSITEQFKVTKQRTAMKPPPDVIFNQKNENNKYLKSRSKRNIKSSLPGLPAARSTQQIEVLERTIHSFRREMFSLNDRLRVLLRYNDQQSNQGQAGEPGPPGKSGPPGIPGNNGRDGYHGARGETGPAGPEGPKGSPGISGKDGLNGANGIPGVPGFKGQKGSKGHKGSSGRHGRDGTPGRAGSAGLDGRQGPPGEKGEAGVCSPCYYPASRYLPRRRDDYADDEEIKKKSQVTYIKWGSSNCPVSSRIVYSGHIGMSKYELESGIYTGSNVVCMPIQSKKRRRYKRQTSFSNDGDDTNAFNSDDILTTEEDQSYSYFLRQPNFRKANTVNKNKTPTDSSDKSKFARLTDPGIPEKLPKYDSEQQNTATTTTETISNVTSNPTISSTTKRQPRVARTTLRSRRNDPKYIPKYADMVGTRKYIPCAVCDIQKQSQQIMMPASSSCPPDWTIQYHGYLMNYHHGTQSANIICVNDQALGISPSSDAGIRRIVSKYLSHIVTDCSTFPCPPLNHSELLKCVVCSK